MRPREFLPAVFGLQLVTVGGLLLLYAWGEYRTAYQALPEPQVIRLRDLVSKGYRDNRHVKVIDCKLGRSYVFVQSNGTLQEVCVPLFPAAEHEDARGPGGTRWLILRTTRLWRVRDVEGLVQDSSVRGVVSAESSIVGREEKAKLKAAYPGLDWSNCLVLEEGRVPMKEGTALVLLVSSGGVVALGGLLFAGWCLFCFRPWLKDYRKRTKLLRAAADSERRARRGRRPAAAPRSDVRLRARDIQGGEGGVREKDAAAYEPPTLEALEE
jgi:hypothetical protein